MVSAVVTAAGKNRRMIEDLRSRGMKPKHKLLMDLNGKRVLVQTIENVLKSEVDRCVVVIGHFSAEISDALKDCTYEKVMVFENPDFDVELSQTLLNGVKCIEPGLCLCVAADQPTVTVETYKLLIKKALEYDDPTNIVSVLARKEAGFLDSAEGLGMPFVCHSDLLLKYLPAHKDNLNPILRKMHAEGVVFYGTPANNELELVNINRFDDYLFIKKHSELF